MLTPYQFASNSPIAGVDLDGLEFFYAADGTFLGSYGESQIVMVVDDNVSNDVAKTLLQDALLNPSEACGESSCNDLFQNSTFIYSDHTGFKKLAGVLYAESDGTTPDAIEEVAAIYSVLENRAKLEGNTVEDQATTGKGVYGAGPTEANKINLADGVGMGTKKKAVYAGLIKGIVTEEDLSNGAFFWDGKDFNEKASQNGGNRERYKPGFVFIDTNHDLYNQGNNKKTGTSHGVTYDYKYESTAAKGKTTFSRLTDAWKNSRLRGSAKSDDLGKNPKN